MGTFNGIEKNKHKFVQKVAKKNILLVSFEFSINISSVRYTGVKIKKGYKVLDRVKFGQFGPSRAKQG